MTQAERILRHLQDYHTITPQEAFIDYGIMRLGARIWELRHQGYNITAQLVAGKNRYGEPTRWAEYRLEER